MISRRDALRLALYSWGTVNLRYASTALQLPNGQASLGRVTVDSIRSYQEPSYKSQPIRWYRRDTLLTILGEVISENRMYRNRRWYQIGNGFIHSLYVQHIEKPTTNPTVQEIPSEGVLGLVTVPYGQSFQFHSGGRTSRLYRLYYETSHWVTGLEQGPDGKPWYRITDELLKIKYFVPASHIKIIDPESISQLSPHVPPADKLIRISLSKQELKAYEADRLVRQTKISSGIPSDGPSANGIPTDTPKGKYHISLKMPSKHMGDGEITAELSAYELLGVPWNCFFTATGVALHGTFWHDNFGSRMSHGCVNLPNQDALWLYRWTDPIIAPHEWYQMGRGTLVIVE